MRWFHAHDWVEVARTYAPPTNTLSEIKGESKLVTQLLAQSECGLTTILWRCTRCPVFRKDELLGQATATD